LQTVNEAQALRFWKCAPGEKEVSGLGVRTSGVGISYRIGRDRSPSWSTFGRGFIASPRTKDPAGASKRPFTGRGQRSTQRMENLVSAVPGATPYIVPLPPLPSKCYCLS